MGLLILWVFLLLLGLALLVKGADWFVDGAAGIAQKCKIPALIVGLTVVAFGTSAPELAVSVASAIGKSTEIAVGNVVGSNVANILLILGISALIHEIPVQRDSLKLDFPVLILSGGLLVGLGVWGRALEWWDGLILVLLFVGYITVLVLKAKKQIKAEPALEKSVPAQPAVEPKAEKPKSKLRLWYEGMCEKTWFLICLTLLGLGMVAGGGTLFVEGAKYIAHYFHVPERIIALTVVAVGTSLPELVTSVVAAAKGETDIAIGNVIGSNIFNVLLIAGVSSLVFPLSFTLEANLIDALVALGAAVLLFFFALLPQRKLGKFAGIVLLGCFLGYYVYLFQL